MSVFGTFWEELLLPNPVASGFTALLVDRIV